MTAADPSSSVNARCVVPICDSRNFSVSRCAISRIRRPRSRTIPPGTLPTIVDAAVPGRSEYGTVEIRQEAGAAADPIFEGVPAVFRAQAAHSQTVVRLPKGGKLLAQNGFGVQSTRMSKTSWGVQFHPEYDAGMMRVLFNSYPAYIKGVGVDVDGERDRLSETPMALRVLRNFARLVKARMVASAEA